MNQVNFIKYRDGCKHYNTNMIMEGKRCFFGRTAMSDSPPD